MARKLPPSNEALRVARSALNIGAHISDKGVERIALTRLGLRCRSQYPYSRSRLLLDAAKMPA